MRHLYVHVPFCARRCVYCDFAIAVRKTIPAARYVDAVLRERDRRIEGGELDDGPLETLYLGGGTPSLLASNELARLVRCLTLRASGSFPQLEITLEANPDDVTASSVAEWMNAGVNRISLGVQSFDDRVLRWMHRTHSMRQAVEAIGLLRSEGIDSLSIDLIFALPEQLSHAFGDDLARAVELGPDHLSVYGLTAEPRTALSRWISRGAVRPSADGRYAHEFLMADDTLSAAGFEHYEVSNYARPEHRARHNGAYWTGRRYIGLGPSAHSFDGRRRSWNVRQWSAYETRVDLDGDATDQHEDMTESQRRLEQVYLGLRTVEGVTDSKQQMDAALCARAEESGWMLRQGNHVSLTVEGWLRLDELAPDLTTLAEGG